MNIRLISALAVLSLAACEVTDDAEGGSGAGVALGGAGGGSTTDGGGGSTSNPLCGLDVTGFPDITDGCTTCLSDSFATIATSAECSALFNECSNDATPDANGCEPCSFFLNPANSGKTADGAPAGLQTFYNLVACGICTACAVDGCGAEATALVAGGVCGGEGGGGSGGGNEGGSSAGGGGSDAAGGSGGN